MEPISAPLTENLTRGQSFIIDSHRVSAYLTGSRRRKRSGWSAERQILRALLPSYTHRQSHYEDIVDAANNAPSGNNMQPWKVYAISGPIKDTISSEMVKAHKNHEPYEARYAYYPPILPPEYQVRKVNFGKFYYGQLGIDYDDFAARDASNTRNYEFFDAPVALIFTMHSEMRQGSWMDLGHFMQSITIAARARGLESVTQLSVPKFDEIIRRHLPIPEEYLVAASISLGHPDLEKIAKYYKRPVKMELGDVLEVYGM